MVETDELVGTLGGVMALGIMGKVAGKMFEDDDRDDRRRDNRSRGKGSCGCKRKFDGSGRGVGKRPAQKPKQRQSTVRDSFW